VVSPDGKELGRFGYAEGGAKTWLAALAQQVPALHDEHSAIPSISRADG
jgi:hypothetical protein